MSRGSTWTAHLTGNPPYHGAGGGAKEEPLRVTHVHGRLSSMGGGDLYLQAVLDGLERRGAVRSTLVVGRVEGPPPPLPPETCFQVKGLAPRRGSGRAALEQLEALVSRLRPDLVHLHDATHPALTRRLASLAPLVVTVQDHRVFCPGRGMVLPDGSPCRHQPMGSACPRCFTDQAHAAAMVERTRERLESLRLARKVMVLSRYMARMLETAGVPRHDLALVPPYPWFGPEVGSLLALPPAPWLLAAGRLSWHKGFQLLLEAMTRLDPEVRLVLAGDGPMMGELEDMARRLLPDRVTFTGWVEHGQVQALLRRARALVLPSLWQEPFGIVGLEAQALGVPVVAFDVGGVSEWMAPGGGWLVPAGDVTSLAGALGEVSRGAPPAMAEAGRRHALEHFSEEGVLAALLRVYREALLLPGTPNAPGSPPPPM